MLEHPDPNLDRPGPDPDAGERAGPGRLARLRAVLGRPWLAVPALLLAGVALGYLLRSGEVGVLRDELTVQRATAADVHREAGMLEGEVVPLQTQLDELQAALEQANRNLGARETELARLQQLVADSGAVSVELTSLQDRYDILDEAYAALRESHDELTARWNGLTPIVSPDLATDALYLDRAVGEISVTRALCTGSMEPNITCDDLLLLYEPASATDLDEGDIIYFRKQAPDCSGPLEGRYTMHRIDNVISNSTGLWFRTKGDAFAYPDSCLVPAGDVLYKLLTTVRNGRLAD